MKGYHESIEYDINHSSYGSYIQENYEIKDEIYRSDMSHIFIIYNEREEKLLLKAIRLNKDIRFDIETAMKLKHSGIAKIHEYGYSEQFMYLIKDYIEGDDLESFINKNGALSSVKAKTIVKKLATILEYLHNFNESSIIYRDLKPSNIILSQDGNVFLIDIITLRTVKEQSTDTFYVATKGFSAPEQYGYSQSTETADIYALGATLFYLLTAMIPDNALTIKKQLQDADKFTESNYKIIRKAMQFNPSKRYKNVESMIKDYHRNHKLIKRLSIIGLTSLFLVLLFAGWVYQSSFFDLETIQTPSDVPIDEIIEIELYQPVDTLSYSSVDEVQISNMTEITSGIEIKIIDSNHVNTSIDKSILNNELKDFEYMTVFSASEPFEYPNIKGEIYEAVVNNSGMFTYNIEGYGSNIEGRNHLLVLLFSETKVPLAYYILNNVVDEEFLMKKENSDSKLNEESVSGEYIVAEGIIIEYNRDLAKVNIDKSIVGDFTYISLWGSEDDLPQSTIDSIRSFVKNDQGVFEYEEVGFTTGYGTVGSFNGQSWILYLLNQDKEELYEYMIYRTIN